MPVVPGPYTKDGIPLEKLRTEVLDDIGMHTEDLSDLIAKFCGAPTMDTTVEIATNSMEMRPIGNSSRPYFQHVDTYTLTLSEPQRYGVAPAITAGAWENGMDSYRLRQHATEALKADRKLCIQAIMDAVFTTFGWYGGWMTPPQYASNIFNGQHSHYLAYAADGLISVAKASVAKRHISEHGHDANSIVGWVNGDQVAALEQSADITDSAIMNSELIKRLQELGFTAAFPLAGIPHMQNEWVPSGYVAYLNMSDLPMRWRVNAEEQKSLIVYDQESSPNAGLHWFQEMVRWVPQGGPDVVVPGAGVVMQLNASGEAPTYAAPTRLMPTAA